MPDRTMVTRAKDADVALTVRQVFHHQAIAEPAGVAGTAFPAATEQGLVAGSVPLTPVQHWFFERVTVDSDHFNQSLMLGVREPLDVAALQRAVRALCLQHDVLRTRYSATPAGWVAVQRGEEVVPAEPVTVVRLNRLPADAHVAAVEAHAGAVQRTLDLAGRPLVRVVLFDCGRPAEAWLLIVAHHLVVDGVSWTILLEDLDTAYRRARRGEAIALPPKTTAFRTWAERLRTHAAARVVEAELPYWTTACATPVAALPVDHVRGEDTAASAATTHGDPEPGEDRCPAARGSRGVSDAGRRGAACRNCRGARCRPRSDGVAGGPRGAWPRATVRGCGPDAHRGLVHDDLSGGAAREARPVRGATGGEERAAGGAAPRFAALSRLTLRCRAS